MSVIRLSNGRVVDVSSGAVAPITTCGHVIPLVEDGSIELFRRDADIDADRELEVPATWDEEPDSDTELPKEVFEDIKEELVQLQAYQSKTSIRERYSDDTWILDYNTFNPTPA